MPVAGLNTTSREQHAFDPIVMAIGITLLFVAGVTTLNDILIPKLKLLFGLDYTSAMLVQTAFYTGYLLASPIAGILIARIGHMRAGVASILLTAAGCLSFLIAANFAVYGMFLLALFILASGAAMGVVVGTSLAINLGAASTASSRLAFAQGFCMLGYTVFPWVGARLLLSEMDSKDPASLTGTALAQYQSSEAALISEVYIGIAGLLVLLAVGTWLLRSRYKEERFVAENLTTAFGLLGIPKFRFGLLTVVCYCGAEVTIGSVLINFLIQEDVMGISAETAGHYVVVFWALAMIGRFVGSWALRYVPASIMLIAVAVGAGLLTLVAATVAGPVAGFALVLIGLFNSVMFPIIFGLSLSDLGPRTSEGAGVLCMGIVGAAILPVIAGKIADLMTLQTALLVPVGAYLAILVFGFYCRRQAPAQGGA